MLIVNFYRSWWRFAKGEQPVSLSGSAFPRLAASRQTFAEACLHAAVQGAGRPSKPEPTQLEVSITMSQVQAARARNRVALAQFVQIPVAELGHHSFMFPEINAANAFADFGGPDIGPDSQGLF